MSTLVIFDLDGTLVDTEYGIAEITVEVAKTEGLTVDITTAFRAYGGLSFADKFNMIASTNGRTLSPERLEELHEEYKLRKKAMYSDPALAPIPGAKDLIRRLSDSPDFTLSVGSSNACTRTNTVLSAMGLSAYFGSRVYGSDMTGGVKKPDPSIFQLAMADNTYDPHNTLVVEDSLAGIKAGHAAGAFVVAVLDPRVEDVGNLHRQAYLDAGANLVISDYDEFETLVSQAWINWPKPALPPMPPPSPQLPAP